MRVRNVIQWGCVLALACCLACCQVKRPDTVLSDGQMEEVLYDYHMAKAMADELPYNESYKKVLYLESVFRKHGITEAEFDSSMAWFARYPDVLTRIYEQVNARLKKERGDINHLVAVRNNKPDESRPGDSVDIWSWRRIYRLTGMPLDNKVVFSFPVDTNFRDRDTLRWTARFQFSRRIPAWQAPVISMQILYKDDTLTTVNRVERSGVQTLSLYADTLGAMKEVRGFIYLPKQDSLSCLLIDRIQLMRYHAQDTLRMEKTEESPQMTPETDTVRKPQPAESQATPRKPEQRPRPTSTQRMRGMETLKPAKQPDRK